MTRSRRGGGDKIFNRNKEEKNKNEFNRKKPSLEKLEKIIISCEGTVTEPLYFRAFFNLLVKKHKISALSFIIAKHRHTNPSGVLDDLINHNENGESYKDFKHKWIVIDRDAERTNGGGHTLEDYNNAINRANQLNIDVAYSNPSFELWYLLHFHYRNTSIDRDSAKKKLQELIGYNKNDKNMFEILLPNQNVAIKYAEKLENICTLNIGNCNPSTSMHNLVNQLNSYMKEDK